MNAAYRTDVSGTPPAESPVPEIRLDTTRQELKELFDPPPEPPTDFPRSHLMRTLTSGKGAAWLAVGAGGLLLAKPKLLVHLVRLLPISALIKMATVRYVGRNL